MLIQVGNKIINTGTLIEAQFNPKGKVLVLRFAVLAENKRPLFRRFKGDVATEIWQLLQDEAQEVGASEDGS